eukprot:7295866-Prorocentrum_lima.AAC.1
MGLSHGTIRAVEQVINRVVGAIFGKVPKKTVRNRSGHPTAVVLLVGFHRSSARRPLASLDAEPIAEFSKEFMDIEPPKLGGRTAN